MKDQEYIDAIDQFVIDFVRDLRLEKGLKQKDIAAILSVGKSFVSNAESLNHRAKYNVRHINILAYYFKMSPKDFLPEKPFTPSQE